VFYNAGSELDPEIIGPKDVDSGFAYNLVECPPTINRLIDIYENVAKEIHCDIFSEISEVLCTLCAQSIAIKKCFAMPLKNKKHSGIITVLKTMRLLTPTSKGPEVKYVFNLAVSLCMSSENVKKIIKDKTIEDILPKILPSKPLQN
jgi:hypothetical protein